MIRVNFGVDDMNGACWFKRFNFEVCKINSFEYCISVYDGGPEFAFFIDMYWVVKGSNFIFFS